MGAGEAPRVKVQGSGDEEQAYRLKYVPEQGISDTLRQREQEEAYQIR